jgi:hypothetical protein
MSAYAWTVGVDWGGAHHHVTVLDSAGAVRGTRMVAHAATAIAEAVSWLQQVTGVGPDAVAVAIETPRGVLVDSLLEHGFAVFAINPKQVDRFRDRFSAGGATDDPRDARVLADALRTDARAFRRVRPDDPQIIYLRELCRIVEELQDEELRLANRLREQLYRVDAAWLTLSPAANDAWLWDLLHTTAHPDRWAGLAPLDHRDAAGASDSTTDDRRRGRRPAAPPLAGRRRRGRCSGHTYRVAHSTVAAGPGSTPAHRSGYRARVNTAC